MIGVVADTHCPEFIDRLPERVFVILKDVRLILHAGDVTAAATLEALARIAPVEAVRGDHDRGLESLPPTRELFVEGKRIMLVHGHRSPWLEEPLTLLWTLSLGYFHPHGGLPRTGMILVTKTLSARARRTPFALFPMLQEGHSSDHRQKRA